MPGTLPPTTRVELAEAADMVVGNTAILKSILTEATDKLVPLMDRAQFVANALAAATPPVPLQKPTTPPSTGGSGVKLVGVFLVIGSLSLAVSAGLARTRESGVMAKTFEDGRQAMVAGKYDEAAAIFEPFGKGKNADALAALAREAECHFYRKDFDMALMCCGELEKKQRTHPMVPYIRALIHQSVGEKELAIQEYERAEFLGCCQAGSQLRILRGHK